MANEAIKTEIRGLKETQAKMEQVVRDLHGEPMLNAFRQATMLVYRDAKINAPVDTGRLRASITPEVRQTGNDVMGVIGSNIEYAPYMELGTGTFAGRSPHFPPPSALEAWARRHGTTGYVVARAIFQKGGLSPRRYLQRAVDKNREQVIRIIGDGVSAITRK